MLVWRGGEGGAGFTGGRWREGGRVYMRREVELYRLVGGGREARRWGGDVSTGSSKKKQGSIGTPFCIRFAVRVDQRRDNAQRTQELRKEPHIDR